MGRGFCYPASMGTIADPARRSFGGEMHPGRTGDIRAPGEEDGPETPAPYKRLCATHVTGEHGCAKQPAPECRRSTSQGDQPAWPFGHPVPELPQLYQLEADPIEPRV